MSGKKFFISDQAKKISSSLIIISGISRSGTTFMGKILGSMKNIEYIYEPPTLLMLFNIINKIDKETWINLFETYIYEEFLINSLSGRYLNFNKNDDSYIYNTKERNEIISRLKLSPRKFKIEKLAGKFRVVIKIPDISVSLKKFREYFPDTTLIIMNRDFDSVYNSIKNKGWYKRKNHRKNLIWPFFKYKNNNIPYWVEKKDYIKWINFSEKEKIIYHFITMISNNLKIKEIILINYSDLIKNTNYVVKKLAKDLKLEFSIKTHKILKSSKTVGKPKKVNILDVDISLLKKLKTIL